MENVVNKNLINSIIKEKMLMSMGAGIIPVPLVDILAVSAIQVNMVRQLCRAYQVDYKESEGKALITALTGASLARMGGSMVKSIPVFGSFFGGATVSVLSGASTYAIGEVFKRHFEKGGTFLDFDLNSIKRFYDLKFEKGKDMASQMSKKEKEADPESDNDLAARLREYDQLLKAEVITQEEFENLKAKLLNQ